MEECPATGRFRKVSASQPRLLVIRRRTIPEPAGNCESSVTRVPDRSAGKQCGGRVPLSVGEHPNRQSDNNTTAGRIQLPHRSTFFRHPPRRFFSEVRSFANLCLKSVDWAFDKGLKARSERLCCSCPNLINKKPQPCYRPGRNICDDDPDVLPHCLKRQKAYSKSLHHSSSQKHATTAVKPRQKSARNWKCPLCY